MIPFEDLTPRGQLRRYHQLARAALARYGISDPRLKFIRNSGNIVFRVDASGVDPFADHSQCYTLHHYALRLHEPGYQADQAILSELQWLSALRQDSGLPVPEPVHTLDGELSVYVELPGLPEPRRCSLLRWVKGRMHIQNPRPAHFVALGCLMARLHTHAAAWTPPPGFTRPRYDWDGLFGDNELVKVPASQVWAHIPPAYLQPFEAFTTRLRQVMHSLGQGPDAFGLIHADISLGDNILFAGSEARPIDFDDCAFGYWMFDAGVCLSMVRTNPAFSDYRQAFIKGYSQIRSLPDAQWMQLDLFIAAWHAFEMYWATAGGILFPESRAGYDRWVERAAQDLLVDITTLQL